MKLLIKNKNEIIEYAFRDINQNADSIEGFVYEDLSIIDKDLSMIDKDSRINHNQYVINQIELIDDMGLPIEWREIRINTLNCVTKINGVSPDQTEITGVVVTKLKFIFEIRTYYELYRKIKS